MRNRLHGLDPKKNDDHAPEKITETFNKKENESDKMKAHMLNAVEKN